jgi:hypothetical protein
MLMYAYFCRFCQKLSRLLFWLRYCLNDIFIDCYADARNDTIGKYQLPHELFPKESPFSLIQIFNADFIP